MNLSEHVKLKIRDLLTNRLYRGRFENCFHKDKDHTSKRGGYGRVWNVMCIEALEGLRDKQYEYVAVKEIVLNYETDYRAKELYTRSKSVSEDSARTLQFLTACQEAVLQSTELRHRNIIRCLCSWVEPPTDETVSIDDLIDIVNAPSLGPRRLREAMTATRGMKFYMVMDYCTWNMLEYLEEKEPERAEVKRLMSQVAEALIYIHEEGYVHKDIKLENILIAESDDEPSTQALLGDFGLCRKSGTGKSGAGTHPFKRYPEPIPVCASDIWSFGLVLFTIYIITRNIDAKRRYDFRLRDSQDEVIDKLSSHICEEDFKRFLGQRLRCSRPQRRLIYDCVRLPADKRPTAEQLAERLGVNLSMPTILFDS